MIKNLLLALLTTARLSGHEDTAAHFSAAHVPPNRRLENAPLVPETPSHLRKLQGRRPVPKPPTYKHNNGHWNTPVQGGQHQGRPVQGGQHQGRPVQGGQHQGRPVQGGHQARVGEGQQQAMQQGRRQPAGGVLPGGAKGGPAWVGPAARPMVPSSKLGGGGNVVYHPAKPANLYTRERPVRPVHKKSVSAATARTEVGIEELLFPGLKPKVKLPEDVSGARRIFEGIGPNGVGDIFAYHSDIPVFELADGSVGKGMFGTNGEMTGLWEIETKNGEYAIGNYKNGKPEGNWKIAFHDAVHEGNLTSGERDGHWKIKWVDGAVHEGTVKNNQRVGPWKATYKDGAVLQGEYLNNRKEGKWTMVYAHQTPAEKVVDMGYYHKDKMQGTWERFSGKDNIAKAEFDQGKGKWNMVKDAIVKAQTRN